MNSINSLLSWNSLIREDNVQYFLLTSVCVNMALDVVVLGFFKFSITFLNILIEQPICSSVYTSWGSGPYRKELQDPSFWSCGLRAEISHKAVVGSSSSFQISLALSLFCKFILQTKKYILCETHMHWQIMQECRREV